MRDDEPTRPADPTPEPTPRPDATPPPEGSGSRPVDPTATQQVPADHGPGGVEGPHGVEGPESTHGGPVAPYGGPGAPVVTDQVRPRLSRLPGRAGSITLIVLGGLLVLLAPVVWWVALMVQSMLLFGDGTVGGETPNGVGLELSSETRYAVDVVPTADLVQDPGAPVGAPAGAPAGPGDDGAAQDAAGAGTDVVVMVATETTETTGTTETTEEPAPATEPAEGATEGGTQDGTEGGTEGGAEEPVDPGLPVCTVVGPAGEELAMEPWEVPDSGGYVQNTFVTGPAGTYTVTCETDPEVGDHTLLVHPAETGAGLGGPNLVVPVIAALVSVLLGLALLIVGVLRLLRVNRRRRELLMAGGVTRFDEELPTTPMHGTPAPAGAATLAPTGLRPSTDPRVEFTAENAFGTRRRSSRPPSFVPGILTLVLGVLLLLGGPAGGIFAPILSMMVGSTNDMGGTTSNGEPIDLPGSTLMMLNVDPSTDQFPTNDADWETWQPPPTPPCTIASPSGQEVALEVERESQGGQTWETATFATADEGPYTVQCQLDDRYSGTLSVWPMGQVGDADGDGEVDQGADGFAFTPLTIGLIVGAVGLVLVIVGIVLLVRASGRRHDLGM